MLNTTVQAIKDSVNNISTYGTLRNLAGQVKALRIEEGSYEENKVKLNAKTEVLYGYVQAYISEQEALEVTQTLEDAAIAYDNMVESEAVLALVEALEVPKVEKVETPQVVAVVAVSAPKVKASKASKVYSFKDMVKASRKQLLRANDALSIIAGSVSSPLKHSFC